MSTWEPNARRDTPTGSAPQEDGPEAGAPQEPGLGAGDAEAHGSEERASEAHGPEAHGGEERGPEERGGEDDLARLDGLPLADHPAVYERIHGELQSALADIDGA